MALTHEQIERELKRLRVLIAHLRHIIAQNSGSGLTSPLTDNSVFDLGGNSIDFQNGTFLIEGSPIGASGIDDVLAEGQGLTEDRSIDLGDNSISLSDLIISKALSGMNIGLPSVAEGGAKNLFIKAGNIDDGEIAGYIKIQSGGFNTGSIFEADIANGGTAYSPGDVLTITGGGNNAEFTVGDAPGGVISSGNISNPGSGYLNGVFGVTGGSGTGATITAIIEEGSYIYVSHYDDIDIFGSNSSNSKRPGGISIKGGFGGAGLTGGAVTIESGGGGYGSDGGGNISLVSGDGGAAAGSAGGINLIAGHAQSGNGNGGSIQLIAGQGEGSGIQGSISYTGLNHVFEGSVRVQDGEVNWLTIDKDAGLSEIRSFNPNDNGNHAFVSASTGTNSSGFLLRADFNDSEEQTSIEGKSEIGVAELMFRASTHRFNGFFGIGTTPIHLFDINDGVNGLATIDPDGFDAYYSANDGIARSFIALKAGTLMGDIYFDLVSRDVPNSEVRITGDALTKTITYKANTQTFTDEPGTLLLLLDGINFQSQLTANDGTAFSQYRVDADSAGGSVSFNLKADDGTNPVVNISGTMIAGVSNITHAADVHKFTAGAYTSGLITIEAGDGRVRIGDNNNTVNGTVIDVSDDSGIITYSANTHVFVGNVDATTYSVNGTAGATDDVTIVGLTNTYTLHFVSGLYTGTTIS